jgi:hypothetical protein
MNFQLCALRVTRSPVYTKPCLREIPIEILCEPSYTHAQNQWASRYAIAVQMHLKRT